MKSVFLTERDYKIIELINSYRFCLGRHIKVLAEFPNARACDRRLKLLLDADLISREKLIYKVPYIYTLTAKGKKLVNYGKKLEKLRLDKIHHDIYVLESLIYFLHNENLTLSDFTSEKTLNSKEGFSNRKHQPDFVYVKDSKNTAVEVEISLKAKSRILSNASANFINFDGQTWVLGENRKLLEILNECEIMYPNIKILKLEDVVKDVSKYY